MIRFCPLVAARCKTSSVAIIVTAIPVTRVCGSPALNVSTVFSIPWNTDMRLDLLDHFIRRENLFGFRRGRRGLADCVASPQGNYGGGDRDFHGASQNARHS